LIELIFLGTSDMFPTPKRNHPSIYLRYEGDYMLFDCGEGTQRQMKCAKLKPARLDYIFITHWHGDHSLGLPGIFQSLSGHGKRGKLRIFGPEGSEERIEHVLKAFSWHKTFKIDVREIDGGLVLRKRDWEVRAMEVKHTSPCLAYSFKERDRRKINVAYLSKFGLKQHPILGKLQRGETIVWKGRKITPEEGTYIKKGKKVTYVTDTVFFDELVDFVRDSDVLICEATFLNKDKELAIERGHMTAAQAAFLAKEGGVKDLYIFHFSQRYKDEKVLVKEAKKIFPNTHEAKDLMRIAP